MSYKTVAALAFTSMFSISTLLSPAYAEEQEKLHHAFRANGGKEWLYQRLAELLHGKDSELTARLFENPDDLLPLCQPTLLQRLEEYHQTNHPEAAP